MKKISVVLKIPMINSNQIHLSFQFHLLTILFFLPFFFFQSVKILTYREPQNTEYKKFVSKLKTDAKKMFNFSMDDSLVSTESLRLKVNNIEMRERFRSLTCVDGEQLLCVL